MRGLSDNGIAKHPRTRDGRRVAEPPLNGLSEQCASCGVRGGTRRATVSAMHIQLLSESTEPDSLTDPESVTVSHRADVEESNRD